MGHAYYLRLAVYMQLLVNIGYMLAYGKHTDVEYGCNALCIAAINGV
jgi:hypothetical protein